MNLKHIKPAYTVSGTKAASEFKSLREKYNMSQVELSDRLGVSQGKISRIERGLLDGHFEAKRFREVFRAERKQRKERV